MRRPAYVATRRHPMAAGAGQSGTDSAPERWPAHARLPCPSFGRRLVATTVSKRGRSAATHGGRSPFGLLVRFRKEVIPACPGNKTAQPKGVVDRARLPSASIRTATQVLAALTDAKLAGQSVDARPIGVEPVRLYVYRSAAAPCRPGNHRRRTLATAEFARSASGDAQALSRPSLAPMRPSRGRVDLQLACC